MKVLTTMVSTTQVLTMKMNMLLILLLITTAVATSTIPSFTIPSAIATTIATTIATSTTTTSSTPTTGLLPSVAAPSCAIAVYALRSTSLTRKYKLIILSADFSLASGGVNLMGRRWVLENVRSQDMDDPGLILKPRSEDAVH